jgi:hypothetical protein
MRQCWNASPGELCDTNSTCETSRVEPEGVGSRNDRRKEPDRKSSVRVHDPASRESRRPLSSISTHERSGPATNDWPVRASPKASSGYEIGKVSKKRLTIVVAASAGRCVRIGVRKPKTPLLIANSVSDASVEGPEPDSINAHSSTGNIRRSSDVERLRIR